jgi:uncharacterized protein YneF (UPF0154 family)
VVVTVEVFLGVLMGLLAGMFLSARYLRQEIAANIGPRLEQIQQQLQSLQAEVSLDSATRLARLAECLDERLPPPDD